MNVKKQYIVTNAEVIEGQVVLDGVFPKIGTKGNSLGIEISNKVIKLRVDKAVIQVKL